MKNKELISLLKKYPDDYDILICHHGYPKVSIEVDHDFEEIYIDGYYPIDLTKTEEKK